MDHGGVTGTSAHLEHRTAVAGEVGAVLSRGSPYIATDTQQKQTYRDMQQIRSRHVAHRRRYT